MTFNPMNFITNLRYLAVGMVSIFIVIGVIILVTVLLNKIFTKK
ncbi:MAG: OadG-related small transporter subunit [Acutalibacteraceae bacterium]|nr:OadG-related small transporter subunit [Acutalibacteraceae bacterium]